MNTRREMALALLGLPVAVRAASPESQTNALPYGDDTSRPKTKPEPGPAPLPHSVDAANIISYTIYAEARGEPWEGMKAVASVIRTRAMRSKLSLAEVCRQSRQFSCWNDLADVPEFYITGEGIQPADLVARTRCFGIAWVLMINKGDWDYLTHFYNPDKAMPAWAYELRGVRTIGRHVFGYIE